MSAGTDSGRVVGCRLVVQQLVGPVLQDVPNSAPAGDRADALVDVYGCLRRVDDLDLVSGPLRAADANRVNPGPEGRRGSERPRGARTTRMKKCSATCSTKRSATASGRMKKFRSAG